MLSGLPRSGKHGPLHPTYLELIAHKKVEKTVKHKFSDGRWAALWGSIGSNRVCTAALV